MAQRARHDEPGALHHVYNRGIAKRTVFERRGDCRFFLSAPPARRHDERSQRIRRLRALAPLR